MKVTKTFEIDKSNSERIPLCFSTQGYKLERTLPNRFIFKRGSRWSRLFAFAIDIKKLPTVVDLCLVENKDSNLQAIVNYDIETIGGMITSEDKQTINNELENLMAIINVK